MERTERHCIVTGEKIEECIGFVLARDMIAYEQGRTNRVREISGRGMLLIEKLAEKEGIQIWEYLEKYGFIEPWRHFKKYVLREA